MDPSSSSSATGLCPEGTAIETQKDCKAAYDWFQAMGSGCPTDAPNGGNCALEPNKNKANALAPASFHVQNQQKGWTDWPQWLLVANVAMEGRAATSASGGGQ